MEEQKLQIKVTDEELKGRYASMAMVSHTKEEFIIDFLNTMPPAGILVSRVFLSPGHIKRLVKVLEEQVERYEKSFGVLKPSEDPKREIGFNIQ